MTVHEGWRNTAASLVPWIALGCVSLAGCGGDDGVSDYDRMMQERKSGEDRIQASGAKLEKQRFPQGEAWKIDLSGKTISDELLEDLSRIGPISELDLSGSTLSDSHAAKLDTMEVSGFLLKLNISQTGFSDAGLAEIKNMNLLRDIILTDSKVTQAGIDKFQQARQSNPNIMAMFKAVSVKK